MINSNPWKMVLRKPTKPRCYLQSSLGRRHLQSLLLDGCSTRNVMQQFDRIDQCNCCMGYADTISQQMWLCVPAMWQCAFWNSSHHHENFRCREKPNHISIKDVMEVICPDGIPWHFSSQLFLLVLAEPLPFCLRIAQDLPRRHSALLVAIIFLMLWGGPACRAIKEIRSDMGLYKVGPENHCYKRNPVEPYKWPKTNGYLGLFHPEISGGRWTPTYNWFLAPPPCLRGFWIWKPKKTCQNSQERSCRQN